MSAKLILDALAAQKNIHPEFRKLIKKPRYSLVGRAVCEIEHGHSRDVVDSFIAKGTWEDTGEPLTDDELEQLQDACGDALCEDALEAGAWH